MANQGTKHVHKLVDQSDGSATCDCGAMRPVDRMKGKKKSEPGMVAHGPGAGKHTADKDEKPTKSR